jgi:peptide-methionine (S)-S-oxide reductase
MRTIIIPVIVLLIVTGFRNPANDSDMNSDPSMNTANTNQEFDTATFGTGCFWCTEAVFEQLDGVEQVVSGYSGGHVKNPSYKEVCSGTTGHAEVCRIIYNAGIISYEELLDVFWHIHDPTTLNRQGNDVGPQYRSVIFYHNPMQRKIAGESRDKMNRSGIFKDQIVTEISPLRNFYEAEDYHQEYFANNPSQAYCSYVIAPKIKKFRAKYQDKLK